VDVSMSLSGASEVSAMLAGAPVVARRATVAGTKAAQKIIIQSVRSKLNGPPRWGHRGKSRIYAESVNKGKQRGGSAGGYPGKLTGDLRKGVGGKRAPIVVGPAVVGGVGIGKKVNNLKKRHLEERFPFFAPSVHESEAAVIAAYATAWSAALDKLG
jgi:hypothetical protein